MTHRINMLKERYVMTYMPALVTFTDIATITEHKYR